MEINNINKPINFPILIKINSEFMLIGEPSQLPIGKSFIVISTNATYNELDLTKKVYKMAWEEADNYYKKDR
jgi:hypothetical protein